jgi:hypothetical protein
VFVLKDAAEEILNKAYCARLFMRVSNLFSIKIAKMSEDVFENCANFKKNWFFLIVILLHRKRIKR